jgi:hypothetical protein
LQTPERPSTAPVNQKIDPKEVKALLNQPVKYETFVDPFNMVRQPVVADVWKPDLEVDPMFVDKLLVWVWITLN